MFQSALGKLLGVTVLVIAAVTIIIPYPPISRVTGFTPIPLSMQTVMLYISVSIL
jgi:hypothetical protein